MKNLSNYFAVTLIVMVTVLSACHTGAKDSTALADSVNQKQILATDSANKANLSNEDSTLKARKTLKEDASKFLVKNYETGLFEIQLSQLAAANGLDTDVKNLAASLVAAHTAINAQISALCTAANFVLPGTINQGHQKDLDDISKLTGADFDKKYISIIVAGHEKSVSNYKDAYKDLAPGETKTFAGETLPKIEDHLAMAKKVRDRIL